MKDINMVVASYGLVACDLVSAEILFKMEGLKNPLEEAIKVKHIIEASKLGLGNIDQQHIKTIEVAT